MGGVRPARSLVFCCRSVPRRKPPSRTRTHPLQTVSEPPTRVAARPPPWIAAGVAALFLSACAFGVLEVHHSTDTWIALAAGRQILHSSTFPKLDTFSYTFYGRPWINQNWLSHVMFWWLYDTRGPDAVAIGTWILGAATFGLTALAVRLRCGSWIAAGLAASVVAFASRDWLSARPATVQFFCLAVLTAALSALLHPAAPKGRNGWALIGVAAVMAVWPHAHGSFVLGFGLLGTFVGCWVVARVLARGVVTPASAIATLVLIGLATGLAGAALSPFGIENYFHPSQIAGSAAFRTVGEWIPPYKGGSLFPAVTRFWAAAGVAAVVLLGALVLRIWGRSEKGRAAHRLDVQAILFDLVTLGVGLGLALFARRFAPVFHILAAPVVTTWALRLAGVTARPGLDLWRSGLGGGAWLSAVVLAFFTAHLARTELTEPFVGGRYDLLDRVTRADVIVRSAFEFLRHNDLKLNVWTEWKQAGPLLFEVPGSRVFIDGRAQQVYSERHYRLYLWMLGAERSEGELLARHLAQSGTEAVLLPKHRSTRSLVERMDELADWLAILETRDALLWVPRRGPLLAELGRRERAGELWWPDNPEAAMTRGLLWVTTAPVDPARAEGFWRTALAGNPLLGPRVYPLIVRALQQQGRAAEAAEFVQAQRASLDSPTADLSDLDRRALGAALDHCETLLKE